MEKNEIENKKSQVQTLFNQSNLLFNEKDVEKNVKDDHNNIEYDPNEGHANILRSSNENNVCSTLDNEGSGAIKQSAEPNNQNKLHDLKESTRKLLCLLEKILQTQQANNEENEPTRIPVKPIQPHDKDGECTIYNRLTRKCQCLNNPDYNDFILLFNENVKHSTCDNGEIIKNMRILKKFLYMGDGYTPNALTFLNEGLSECTLSEKSDVIQGCVYADICNVFEENSIVALLLIKTRKLKNYGDQMTQVMTAQILHKIARTEEGKRYLNYNSKITFDIKYALKKYSNQFNCVTVEPLNSTLDLLQRHFSQNISISYYCKPINKGIGVITLLNLAKRRSPISLEELLLNLELLCNLTKQDRGKMELKPYLPDLVKVLKKFLKEYDSSEINIITTSLLKNVISKSMLKNNSFILNNKVTVKSTATEPNKMKPAFVQVDEFCPRRKPRKIKLKNENISHVPMEKDNMYDFPIVNDIKEVYRKTKRQIIVVPSNENTKSMKKEKDLLN